METTPLTYANAPRANYAMALNALVGTLMLNEFSKMNPEKFCKKYELHADFITLLVDMEFLETMLIEGDWAYKKTKSLYNVAPEHAQAWMQKRIGTLDQPGELTVSSKRDQYQAALKALDKVLSRFEMRTLETVAFTEKHGVRADLLDILVQHEILVRSQKAKVARFKKSKQLATLQADQVLAWLDAADSLAKLQSSIGEVDQSTTPTTNEKHTHAIEQLHSSMDELNALPPLTNPTEKVLEEVTNDKAITWHTPKEQIKPLLEVHKTTEVTVSDKGVSVKTTRIPVSNGKDFGPVDPIPPGNFKVPQQKPEICSGDCGDNHCDSNGCVERVRVPVEVSITKEGFKQATEANKSSTALFSQQPDTFEPVDNLLAARAESTPCECNCGLVQCEVFGCKQSDTRTAEPSCSSENCATSVCGLCTDTEKASRLHTRVEDSGMPAFTAPYSDVNIQSSSICIDCIDCIACTLNGCFRTRYPAKVTTAPTTGPFTGPGSVLIEPPRTIDSSKEPRDDYAVYDPSEDIFYTKHTFETAKKVAEEIAEEKGVAVQILRTLAVVERIIQFKYTSLT